MGLYKAVLKEWHKGTGSRSGLNTDFEGWSDSKLNKYNVQLDLYDHTNVTSMPAVFINEYCKQRTPYLTVTHLWNTRSDYLLSSKYDPLNIGLGEGGIPIHNLVTSCSASTSLASDC